MPFNTDHHFFLVHTCWLDPKIILVVALAFTQFYVSPLKATSRSFLPFIHHNSFTVLICFTSRLAVWQTEGIEIQPCGTTAIIAVFWIMLVPPDWPCIKQEGNYATRSACNGQKWIGMKPKPLRDIYPEFISATMYPCRNINRIWVGSHSVFLSVTVCNVMHVPVEA